jgi:PAS domain S-box-containing protein
MAVKRTSRRTHPRRALIAEDDESVRWLLQELLEGEGYTVEAVADGAEALARVRAAPPELLVSDAVMPGLDGFSLCRRLRAEPRFARLPILLASASFHAPHDERLARAAGGSAFVRKPAAVADWLGAVRQALAAPPPVPVPEREFNALYAEVLGDQLARRQGELDEKRVQLRGSETRFRDIFDNINDLIFIVEPGTGRILDANRRACEFLGLIEPGGGDTADRYAHAASGCHCAELLALTVAELGPPEEAELSRRALRDATEKESVVFERNLRRRDGALVPYEVNARRTAFNGRDVIVSVARDVSDRKQAESALRERDEILRLFVEHSPAAIAMFDNEMRYLVASRRWSEDYGLGDQNIVGRSHYEIFPEIPERWKAIHRRCLAGAVERSEEDPFVRADGRTDWVRWEVRPWRQASGEIGGIIIFSEVITATKEAEHRIAADAERLEQLSRRLLAAQEDDRRRVARELHDEIGQLLTVVKLDLQAVLRQGGASALAPALKEGMDSIDRAVARVRDLSLDLRPSMLDDLGLVPALRWYAQRQGELLGIGTVLSLPETLPRLPGEIETACFRVAQEALTNVARHARARRVELTLTAKARELRLTVRDDGAGFDPEAQRRAAPAGGGFGLLGMRERVELAGGEFRLASTPGAGTTVEARFPVPGTGGAVP